MKDKKYQKETLELQPEQKAYIYQQLNDFVRYFDEDSDIGVFIQQEDEGEEEVIRYAVTLVLSGGGSFVRSTGRDKDLYAATNKAKADLLEHLQSIEAQILDQEDSRSDEIQQIKDTGSIH